MGLSKPCRPFAGCRTKKGYGQLTYGGKAWRAHRLAWTQTYGPIPPGLCVLHQCDNPPCIEPTHLFLGTRGDNNRDAAAKGRTRNGNSGKTRCKRGHCAFYTRPNGTRYCRECRRINA